MLFNTSTEGKSLLTPMTVEEGEAFYRFICREYIPTDEKFEPLHALIQRVGRMLQMGERMNQPPPKPSPPPLRDLRDGHIPK